MSTDSDDENLESIRTSTSSNEKMLQLPMARIKTIMKSSPELVSVSKHSYFLVAKATELFTQYLAKEAYNRMSTKKSLDYKALSTVVKEDEALEFLEEIVPPKITVAEYWKKIGKNDKTESTASDNVPSPTEPPVSTPTKSGVSEVSSNAIIID